MSKEQLINDIKSKLDESGLDAKKYRHIKKILTPLMLVNKVANKLKDDSQKSKAVLKRRVKNKKAHKQRIKNNA